MATFTIRNVETAHAEALKIQAAAAGKSVEQMLRDVIANMVKTPIHFGCNPEWEHVSDEALLAPLDTAELEAWHS